MLVRIWILLSAILCAAGWLLSAVHQLNWMGYGAVLGTGLAAALWWWRRASAPRRASWQQTFHRLYRRFKQPAPMAFLVFVLLAMAIGVLYPPTPSDESQYRTPRVLHWLAEGHWHWIRTFDIRMNIIGCGFEWLTAPLALFTHTDRLFFLINLISYVLLPGLCFSVFRRLQVRGRVAWWWMWLVPAACCYIFQAGTALNDSFTVIYALAAVDLALRAREEQSVSDLWFSMLAAALVTGSKQTNLPLALLWLIAVWPALAMLRTRPLGSLAIMAFCLLASALPMMILSELHDCNWLGAPKHPGPDWLDMPWPKTQLTSPFWGVLGNAFCLPLQNLAPPFFPCYEAWNNFMQRFVQTPFGSHFSEFESFGHLPSFPSAHAGPGFFLSLFFVMTLLVIWFGHRKISGESSRPTGAGLTILLLRWTPWLLLVLFMAKVGTYQNARQLAPYYVFLLPSLLVQPGNLSVTRQRWWQMSALSVLMATVMLVVFSPAYPLWPAETVLGALSRSHPNSKFIVRLQSFYYGPEINEAERHPFRDTLPPNERVVGYATNQQGLEPALWIPFVRRVERVLPDDTTQELQQQGIRYIVVDGFFLGLTGSTIDQLLKRYDAQLVDRMEYYQGFGRPPGYFYLIRLSSAAR